MERRSGEPFRPTSCEDRGNAGERAQLCNLTAILFYVTKQTEQKLDRGPLAVRGRGRLIHFSLI